jgi:hypothetical protein
MGDVAKLATVSDGSQPPEPERAEAGDAVEEGIGSKKTPSLDRTGVSGNPTIAGRHRCPIGCLVSLVKAALAGAALS